jgi:hypothetical protein
MSIFQLRRNRRVARAQRLEAKADGYLILKKVWEKVV